MSANSSTAKAVRRLNSIRAHVTPHSPNAEPDTTQDFEHLRINRKEGDVPWLSPLDPVRFVLRSALVHANRTAVMHRDSGYSFKTLAERIRRFSNALLDEYKMQRGDRVAILCQNIPAFLEAGFAIPSAGGIMVPLNTRISSEEIDYILKHSGASIILVQDELFEKLSPEAKSLRLIRVADYQLDTPNCQYERLLETTPAPRSWDELPLTKDENAVYSINYTSGSTGRPKGVMTTFRGSYITAIGMMLDCKLSSNSVYLWTLPMFHCNGWNFPWANVAAGAKQIMLNKMDYTYIWKMLKEQGVTHYCGAPTVQNELCNHKDAARLSQEVWVYSGGAAVSSTLIRRMRALNLIPNQVYGLTETYGPAALSYERTTISHLSEKDQHALLARQGFGCIVSDEIRVLNRETGKDVVPNGKEIGEICMSGNQVMRGYYNDPKETEKCFAGGVFWTGDMAVRHPDGAIEIVDRSKDVIISGGENISSIQVESIIVQLEEVSECAIVAAPDEKWGERPYAFVVLKEGRSISAEAILDHCHKHLAGFKCPTKVTFVESLPKTSTGKCQKYVLREKLWKNYTKRVN